MKKYRISKKTKELAREVYEKEMIEIENVDNDNIYFRTSINCNKCSRLLEGFGEYLSMYNELRVKSYVGIENPDLLCFLNNKRVCHIKYLAYILGNMKEREEIDIDKVLK